MRLQARRARYTRRAEVREFGFFLKTWELDSDGWSSLSPDIYGDVEEVARKEDKEEEEQVNRIVKL